MAYDALHKGFYGVDYRTLIGLHRQGASSTSVTSPTDAAWDVYVGPLPFLLANKEDRPYLRESVPARRERVDQSREPGENNLDSGLWLRSQTSWHLGAGQAYAEPLEESGDVARFRFSRSAGVDPWEAGQLSLLPQMDQRDTNARQCLGVPGVGVVVSTASAGVRKYPTSGASTQLSTKTVTKITANTSRWFGVSSTGLEWGDLSGATGEGGATRAGITALHWGRDRLWVGVSAELHEITASTPAFSTAFHTFRSGSIVDIDSGAGGIYVLVNGALSSVYVVTVKDDGTLNPPREVATLPRGETGTFLYGYLGRYLVIGTNKGVRVADSGTAQDLPVGPLIEVAGGCNDAVGDSSYLWVTAGTAGIYPDPEGAARPGLIRLDTGRPVTSVSAYGDSAAARYAYATDVWAETTGDCWSVTVFDGDLFMVAGSAATGSPLWQQSDSLVDIGWVESGQVSYSTAERKTWLSMSVEVDGRGYFLVEANTGAGFNGVTQSQVAVPFVGDQDLDATTHPTSGWLQHRITLYGDGTNTVAGSPTLTSIALRATPAPKRSRYVRLPLLVFDEGVDRYGNTVGYDGFAYDRVKDLESLEEVGGLISVTDARTGETMRCQIERVSVSGTMPPARGSGNFGGIVELTLLTV